MKCKRCGVDKLRMRSPRKRHDGRTIYLDEKNKRWIGHVCGACEWGNRLNIVKAKPTKEEVFTLPADPLTKRKCGKCKRRLPRSRYYHHEACAPQIDYYDIFADYVHHG